MTNKYLEKIADKIDIKHPGLLHKKLGIPEGQKIPTSLLQKTKAKAVADGNKKLMEEANFALVAKKWKK